MYLVENAAVSEKPGDVGAETDAGVSSSIFRPVYVSAVEHPEHFWMQMLSERSTQLDSLVSEMTSFYETEVSQILSLFTAEGPQGPVRCEKYEKYKKYEKHTNAKK